jgi:TatD DNase family protein
LITENCQPLGMNLTDTHAHLDSPKFDLDRADVLLRAEQAGLTHILIPGVTLRSSRSAVILAENHPMLFAAVGIHPTETDDFTSSALNHLRKLAQSPRVKAIGEIGLDYYWDSAAHDLQQMVLREQLDLAGELHLPVLIHFREKGDAPDGPCAADLLKLLDKWTGSLRQEHNPLAERPGVLHSFSGSAGTARQTMDLHFFLGVTGPLTYLNERQELITFLPLESLLLETDAPYLAPVPQRGKRNEPAFVRHIADKIALLRSISVEQIAAVTAANAARLFSWE